jgi:hypothetical protein
VLRTLPEPLTFAFTSGFPPYRTLPDPDILASSRLETASSAVRRDAAWMRPIYQSLGLTVASIGGNDATEERRAAYQADIVYLTAGNRNLVSITFATA